MKFSGPVAEVGPPEWTTDDPAPENAIQPDPKPNAGDGTSRSVASRRFMAMREHKLSQWLSGDLSKLDLLAIQIDRLSVADEVRVAAVGIDAEGKYQLALVEGATENAAVAQALCSAGLAL